MAKISYNGKEYQISQKDYATHQKFKGTFLIDKDTEDWFIKHKEAVLEREQEKYLKSEEYKLDQMSFWEEIKYLNPPSKILPSFCVALVIMMCLNNIFAIVCLPVLLGTFLFKAFTGRDVEK